MGKENSKADKKKRAVRHKAYSKADKEILAEVSRWVHGKGRIKPER